MINTIHKVRVNEDKGVFEGNSFETKNLKGVLTGIVMHIKEVNVFNTNADKTFQLIFDKYSEFAFRFFLQLSMFEIEQSSQIEISIMKIGNKLMVFTAINGKYVNV
ncbi:MAG: hypothetical protein CH6_0221 [Candidatus Kapaibacterium sp.]|nr:MAG: hypothetical protein CH6_0221 [Candidatus Kapabacteria bacterium]